MKAVMIIYNQAHTEKVEYMLDKLGIKGYSLWENVQGRGTNTGVPHLGTHTWPEINKSVLTIIEDDLVDLEGRTTHSQPHDGRYISGITFLKITKNGRRVFAKYVEAFRQRKRELQEKLNGAAE